MWKPWVIAVIGSVLVANAAAKGLAPSSSVAKAHQNEIEKFGGFTDCQSEIERVCGAHVNQQVSEVIINKKGTFKGTGNERVDLVNALRSAVSTLSTPLPGNFNALCTNVNANVAQDI